MDFWEAALATEVLDKRCFRNEMAIDGRVRPYENGFGMPKTRDEWQQKVAVSYQSTMQEQLHVDGHFRSQNFESKFGEPRVRIEAPMRLCNGEERE